MATRKKTTKAPRASHEEKVTERIRDANLDRMLAADADFDLWETESEVLSIKQVKDLIARLRGIPGVEQVVEALEDVGADRIRAFLSRVLSAPADRPIDDFGLDPVFYEELFPVAKWIHDKYFRVEATGVEHIPSEGRALVVANHSGTLPYDGAMVVTTVRINHPGQRRLRALVENFVYHMPYLGKFMARGGAVRACQENAVALLEADEAVLVFPEGVKGIGKLFRKRYRLQRFGRGGAIRLALKTNAPIIPCSIVGAEESMPLLGKVSWLARPLGIPYIPLTPTMPLLGPLGAVPFPTKWFIDFAPPIHLHERYGPDAIDDRVLVNRCNEEVRGVIQDLIDARLAQRDSVLFG
ncbi:MAG: lysophospholipid acyltransferase family protein [Myxococcota bacterium]